MTPPAWKPLFSGTAAEPFERAIDDILVAIDSHEADYTDWGRPLLHAYLANARYSTAHRARAEELVDRAVESMGLGMLRPSLYGGFAGVAWLAAHVDTLFDRRDDEPFEELDEAVLQACVSDPTTFVYDLISGHVGLGVYFLERLPHQTAREALQRITEVLGRHCERDGEYARWFTPPALVPASKRERAPRGYYNLGVAHGVPGIIGLLGEMRRAGITSPESEALLIGAMRWVLSEHLPNGLLPPWVAPGAELPASHVSWCYGELGASVTLLLAARALGDRAFEDTAIDTALRCAARRDDASVMDAGLCHGAGGNGHLFNRLYQATGRSEFLTAAEHWFNRALEMRSEGEGLAGYRTYRPGTAKKRKADPWEEDPSFLTGVSGIALALVAATASVEPKWDRVLLSSVRPAR